MSQPFLEETNACCHCLLRRDFVAAEGKVGHYQSTLGGPGHRPAQREEFIDRYGEAGFVSEDIVGSRIANQQDLDARLIEDFGRVLLVGRQHRKPLTLGLGLLKVVRPDPGRSFWCGSDRRSC